ncbi:MAG TPA: hypothetical protein VJ953_14585 [Saprospiraceae bacterium]|nr:hypothetical protein [Saprospiraceae bacterium]
MNRPGLLLLLFGISQLCLAQEDNIRQQPATHQAPTGHQRNPQIS